MGVFFRLAKGDPKLEHPRVQRWAGQSKGRDDDVDDAQEAGASHSGSQLRLPKQGKKNRDDAKHADFWVCHRDPNPSLFGRLISKAEV